MKIAPLMRAIQAHNDKNGTKISPYLVHTGQHYDVNMSHSFFKDLCLPEPDMHLGIGAGTHGEQTGKILIAFEKVLFKERPDLVIVVGDVNSTLACTLAAAKLHIPVAHVEAGLRSFDPTMPEEINRLLTDAISDYLFTPSPDADGNLKREGIPSEKIFLVGNIMIDSLLFNLEQAKKTNILDRLDLRGNPHSTFRNQQSAIHNPQSVMPYALVTLHRPSNVDDKDVFLRIINALTDISKHIRIIFPIHPRTRKRLADLGLGNPQSAICNLYFLDPLGYLEFLNLMAHATVILTDSGGIQEETTVLGIPCLTLRDTTERPITITQGTNRLVNVENLASEIISILNSHKSNIVNSIVSDHKSIRKKLPELWDGKTAERIVNVLSS